MCSTYALWQWRSRCAPVFCSFLVAFGSLPYRSHISFPLSRGWEDNPSSARKRELRLRILDLIVSKCRREPASRRSCRWYEGSVNLTAQWSQNLDSLLSPFTARAPDVGTVRGCGAPGTPA